MFSSEVLVSSKFNSEFVAEGHLADGLNDATETEGISTLHLTGLNSFSQSGILVEGVLIVGHAIPFLLDIQQDQHVSCGFQFGGNDML